MPPPTPHHFLDPAALSGRERYQLLTSLVVPRPIAWVGTRSADGQRNLAPFSYFAALSASPMLVGVSVGQRGGEPKDTLRNIRETGEFTLQVVTDRHLEAMNATSAEVAHGEDEFRRAGLQPTDAERVGAPLVADAPAVLECRLFREVELGDAPNTLLIGEVVGIRLDAALPLRPGTHFVEPGALRPVGRLGGTQYTRLGEVVERARP